MEKGFILSLIFTGIVAVFALNNSEVVNIDLIFTTISVSQAIVILISALLGAIVVAILGFFRKIKMNREIKSLKEEKENIATERASLIEQLESKDKQIMSLYDINRDRSNNLKISKDE